MWHCKNEDFLKFGRINAHFVTILTDLILAMWMERQVPQDCHSCPSPKKDNLHCCDNWRRIELLDVVGKMLGRIVQNHLQKLIEKVLLELQCGFRF